MATDFAGGVDTDAARDWAADARFMKKWWRAVAVLISGASMSAVLLPHATAADPTRNGAIAYFWPDPIADAAYLAFVTPDGAGSPSKWVQSWESNEDVLAFSPDGLQVVGGFNGDDFGPLGVASAPGRCFTKITHPHGGDWDGEPSWSPDGRSLVFVRNTGGTPLLYTVRADGTHLRRIGHGGNPVWSSTGRIAFMRFRHDYDRYSIYTSTATGKDVRRLTYGRYDASPAWSPDGRRIVFERAGDIASIAADGGDLRALTQNPRAEGDPAYSPDGTQIVFATYRKLIVIPSEGGRERAYPCEEPSCFGPTWLPATPIGSALHTPPGPV